MENNEGMHRRNSEARTWDEDDNQQNVTRPVMSPITGTDNVDSQYCLIVKESKAKRPSCDFQPPHQEAEL